MRLIDADALQSEYMRYHDGKRSVLVDVAPTIEERKKGKWIVHEGQDEMYADMVADMVCSSCKKHYQVAEIRAADIAKKFKFCPNCGARMEGER